MTEETSNLSCRVLVVHAECVIPLRVETPLADTAAASLLLVERLIFIPRYSQLLLTQLLNSARLAGRVEPSVAIFLVEL